MLVMRLKCADKSGITLITDQQSNLADREAAGCKQHVRMFQSQKLYVFKNSRPKKLFKTAFELELIQQEISGKAVEAVRKQVMLR